MIEPTEEKLATMSITDAMKAMPACDDEEVRFAAKVALMKRWRIARIKKYGWVGDFVSDDTMPYGLNIHTHGIAETLNHPDLQIVASIGYATANSVIHHCVGKIKQGMVFVPGNHYDEIIKDLPVTFVKAIEDNREVLRVILPDKDGNLDRETNRLAKQYDGTL